MPASGGKETGKDTGGSLGRARGPVAPGQEGRKQAELQVSDRIRLRLTGSPEAESVAAEHRDYIMGETLAGEWPEGDFDPQHSAERSLDQEHWRIELAKAE